MESEVQCPDGRMYHVAARNECVAPGPRLPRLGAVVVERRQKQQQLAGLLRDVLQTWGARPKLDINLNPGDLIH